MIEDAYGFDSSRETGVDNAIDVGVKGLEDGDGTFVSCVGFVMEKASSDLEEGGEGAGGEDEGNETIESCCPVRVHTCEDVEVEVLVSGLRGDVPDVFNEIWKFCGEDGGGGGGGGWFEVKRPCCFERIGWCGVLVKKGEGMGSKEFMCVNDVLLDRGWEGGSIRVVAMQVFASEGACMGKINGNGSWTNFVVEEGNEVEGMA